MSAPVLLSLADAHAVVRQGLPPLSGGDSVAHFVVVRHGECVHGQWGAGEVLVCRGEARDGDLVVLVARGHGRPRVGTVRGGRLYGDAGEPCHAGRWTVAGRLVATWRQRDGGWIILGGALWIIFALPRPLSVAGYHIICSLSYFLN